MTKTGPSATRIAFALAALLSAGEVSAGMIINPTNNAFTLGTDIEGTGITLTGTATYTSGDAYAFGTFSNGNDGYVGIDSGIIISTGAATDALGPNSSTSTTTDHSTGGLPQATPGTVGVPTYDGAALTVQFQTATYGDLNFSFAVGTEETPPRSGGTGDVFSFFLNGSPAYFGSVTGNQTYSGYNVQTYSGYTVGTKTYGIGTSVAAGDPNQGFNWISDVINVTLTGLLAGTHSLSIYIADTWDGLFDSAVFVGPVTLAENGTPIPVPASHILLGTVVVLLMYRRRANKK